MDEEKNRKIYSSQGIKTIIGTIMSKKWRNLLHYELEIENRKVEELKTKISSILKIIEKKGNIGNFPLENLIFDSNKDQKMLSHLEGLFLQELGRKIEESKNLQNDPQEIFGQIEDLNDGPDEFLIPVLENNELVDINEENFDQLEDLNPERINEFLIPENNELEDSFNVEEFLLNYYEFTNI